MSNYVSTTPAAWARIVLEEFERYTGGFSGREYTSNEELAMWCGDGVSAHEAVCYLVDRRENEQ